MITSSNSSVNEERVAQSIIRCSTAHHRHDMGRAFSQIDEIKLTKPGHFTQIPSGKADECNGDFSPGYGMTSKTVPQP
jgi:hypothetical protein